MSNVKIPTKFDLDGEFKEVQHIPIELTYLENSVIELIGADGRIPDYINGYNVWSNAVSSGGAGAFKMDVADCIDYTAQAVKSQLGSTTGG